MLESAEMGASILSGRPTPQLREATQRAFLEALQLCGTVGRAAEVAGINRDTATDWLRRTGAVYDPATGQWEGDETADDTGFLRAFRAAKEQSLDLVESGLHRRALEERGMPGVLASFGVLKAGRPARWAEQMQVKVSGTVWHANVDLGTLSDQDRAQLLALAAERATLRLTSPDLPPTTDE